MFGNCSTNVVTEGLSYYPRLTLTLMKFTSGTYESTTAINLAPYKTFSIMLEQINTETNKYNGAPSTVLDIVSVETSHFGEIMTVIRELPCFKLLGGGLINELKVSTAVEYRKYINNNSQPITVVIQIIKHEHLRGGYSYHHQC